jgi:hypothetical protein
VFRDIFLHDVGDEVETLVNFSLRHKDVTAARYVAGRRLRVAEE